MTHATSSTYDEVVLLQPAQETRMIPRIAAAVRRCRNAVSPTPSARDRYLGAAVDHDDFERRRKAWDAREEGALRRLSAGLY